MLTLPLPAALGVDEIPPAPPAPTIIVNVCAGVTPYPVPVINPPAPPPPPVSVPPPPQPATTRNSSDVTFSGTTQEVLSVKI